MTLRQLRVEGGGGGGSFRRDWARDEHVLGSAHKTASTAFPYESSSFLP